MTIGADGTSVQSGADVGLSGGVVKNDTGIYNQINSNSHSCAVQHSEVS